MSTKKLQIIDYTVQQAQNADTVDGKHASEFASATDLSDLQGKVGDVAVSEQISTAVANKQDGPLIGTIDTTADNYITPAQVIDAVNSGRDVIVIVPSVTWVTGTVDNVQLTTVNTADNCEVSCSTIWNGLTFDLHGDIYDGWSEPTSNTIPSTLMGTTDTTDEMYIGPSDVCTAMLAGRNVILATRYQDKSEYFTSFTSYYTSTDDIIILATGHAFNAVHHVWGSLSDNTWSEVIVEAYATQDQLTEVSNLVGDTSVSDQISAATIAITNAEIDEICGQVISVAEDVTL